MNNERYIRMIRYKAELDNSWKYRDPLNPYDTNYEKLLGEVKIAGFKVLRNSKGEHKLIDEGDDGGLRSMFADVIRGRG